MSSFDAIAGRGDPTLAGYHREVSHAAGELVSKRVIVGYGFWIFPLSDIVMFSAFFATYAVLVGETAGGPSGHELFDLRNTAIETACLLLSSFACGLASIGAQAHRGSWFHAAMAATFILGAAFIGLEVREFADLVARGAGPTRSAFLSAFFTLVGCHGLHVTAGLLWLLTMMAQVFAKGYESQRDADGSDHADAALRQAETAACFDKAARQLRIASIRGGSHALSLRSGWRLLRCWRLPSVAWYCELKGGAVRRVRRRPEASAMRLDDRSADGKPHTHAVWFRREQGLEEAIGYRRIYARAGILDRNKNAPESTRSEDIVSTLGRSMTALMASLPFMIRLSTTCCI
jgi:cytochrome o ubiquinol oxidase subunit 3